MKEIKVDKSFGMDVLAIPYMYAQLYYVRT